MLQCQVGFYIALKKAQPAIMILKLDTSSILFFSLFKLSNLRACTSGSSDQQNACMIKKIPETKDLEACILVACSKL